MDEYEYEDDDGGGGGEFYTLQPRVEIHDNDIGFHEVSFKYRRSADTRKHQGLISDFQK